MSGFDSSDPRSIFNTDGDIRPSAGGNMNVGDYVDVRNVDWPKLAGYGWDHARHTAQLVDHLALRREQDGGVASFSLADVRIISAAALLHDSGRTKFGGDPDHYRKGAEIAERVLSEQGWTADDRNEVCRLIFKHGDRDAARGDRRLQVLQDCDRLEAVRFGVGTVGGLAKIQDVCKPELFWSPWAANAGTLRVWLKFSGWKV